MPAVESFTRARSQQESRNIAVSGRCEAGEPRHPPHLCLCGVPSAVQSSRHATIEHPWSPRAWKTRALAQLYGFATYVDQCELGLELENDQGQMLPARKPTCLFTTRKNV